MGWVHFLCGILCTQTLWSFGYLGNYKVTCEVFRVMVPDGLQRRVYATSSHPQRRLVDVSSQKVDTEGSGESTLDLNSCQEWELVHPGGRKHNVLHRGVPEEFDGGAEEQYIKAGEDAELASKGGIEDNVVHLGWGIKSCFKVEVVFAVAV